MLFHSFSRFLHPIDKSETKKFLIWHQTLNAGCHVAAWLLFALVWLAAHGDASAITRALAFVVPLLACGPAAAAVHWVIVVGPSYDGDGKEMEQTAKNVEEDDDEEEGKFRKEWLYACWQGVTTASRLVSAGLLASVFRHHWSEAPAAFAYGVAYASAVIFVNAAIHLSLSGREERNRRKRIIRAFCSALAPNGFRSAQPRRVGRYIVANVTANLLLHLAAWLSVAFYCWECTKALDPGLLRFSSCFPATAGLWVAALALTLLAWRLSIAPALTSTRASLTSVSGRSTSVETEVDVVAAVAGMDDEPRTPWPATEEPSLTTKL